MLAFKIKYQEYGQDTKGHKIVYFSQFNNKLNVEKRLQEK